MQVSVTGHDLILDVPCRSALHLKGADRCRGDILHAGQSDLGKDGPPEAPLLAPNRTGESDDRNPTGFFRHLHILNMDHAMIAHVPEQGGAAQSLPTLAGLVAAMIRPDASSTPNQR